MNQATDAPTRPLSPFLIYRWGISNSLSILHRITGVCMSLGLLVLACWLIALATGPEAFESVMDLYGSLWFRIPLAGWVFCFFYHLANGIRHLVWDAGFGFDRRHITIGGIAVVVFSVLASAIYLLIAWT